MDPGPGNPMGARALHLFDDGVDTFCRIHGDAAPEDLSRAVSQGCVRMLDPGVIDLERRSVHGAAVTMLPSVRPAVLRTGEVPVRAG